jgi:drug/metabolite transporter (DMT)-like permease
VASVVYGILGQRIPPLQLNLIKGIVAIALLWLTILISGDILPTLAPVPVFLLLLSGALGIGLGDTAYLGALNCLGPRRALLLGTLSPPIIAIGATIFLQENLQPTAWYGILLTVLGVAWVITERVSDNGDHSVTYPWQGIGLGILSVLEGSAGAICSRAALANTDISPVWAAFLRLIAGEVTILLCACFSQQRRTAFIYPVWESRRVLLATFLASFCGTYLGIWLQQMSIKYTSAGIASTLMQTSPLFILPIAAYMGEKVSKRAIFGVIIAVGGIWLLFHS